MYKIALKQPILYVMTCAFACLPLYAKQSHGQSPRQSQKRTSHDISLEQASNHMKQYQWFIDGRYDEIVKNSKHKHDLITECALYINARVKNKKYSMQKITDEHRSKMISTLLAERIHKILSSYRTKEEFGQYKHELNILKELFESLEHHPIENDHVPALIDQHHQHHA